MNACNDVRTRISACSLTENTSINPEQCIKLKFGVQIVEIDCRKLKLNWLTESRENEEKVKIKFQRFNTEFEGEFRKQRLQTEEKQLLKVWQSLSSKNGHESMICMPWIKFSRSFTCQFVRKRGKLLFLIISNYQKQKPQRHRIMISLETSPLYTQLRLSRLAGSNADISDICRRVLYCK